MPVITRENCKLYYELRGKGHPVVLINGFSQDLGMWDNMIPTLLESFQVMTFDNRGAGRSDTPPGPYSIDQMADDLIFIMDTIGIEKPHLIGFSMGTMIIQSLALRYANRLSKAIMIAPLNRLPKTAYMHAKNTAKLRDHGVTQSLIIEQALPWIFSSEYLSQPDQVKKIIKKQENNPFPQSAEGYDRQLEAIEHFDQTNALDQIHAKVLLIAGDTDLYISQSEIQLMKKRLKQVKLEILPGVGYMPHVEKEDEVLKIILKFLQN